MPPDLTGLLLSLAAEVGAARPRAWGDGVAETLRLIGLRLPPRANIFAEFVDAGRIAGADSRSVSAATTRRLPPWMSHEDAPPWLASGGTAISAPELLVARLPEAHVVQFGPAPLVVAADGRRIARDISSRYAPLVHFARFDLRAALDSAIAVPGPVFLLNDDVWPPNYSHWLLDALPRLAALDLSGWKQPVTLATGPLVAPYQRETLARCGFDAARIVELAPMRALRAGAVLATSDQPQPPHPLFKGAPWAARFLRRTFGIAGGRADPARGRRLYLSRADAGWRRVLNEPDLIAALSRRGFESVSLGAMTVAEQAALLDSAAWIVAPHGAGLANLVFARPGTTVLEIFPRRFGTPAFYYLAAAMGLRYGCHIVADTGGADDPGHADFSIDPEVVTGRYSDLLPT